MKIENENMIIFENYICEEANITIATKVIVYSKERNNAKSKDVIIIFGDIQKKQRPVICMDNIIVDIDKENMSDNLLDIFKSVINNGLFEIYAKSTSDKVEENISSSIEEIVEGIRNFINN